MSLEQSTERFNDKHDRVFRAALAQQQLARNFTARSEAECKWILRRNAAIAAGQRSLFREFPDLLSA
jgi:hypothetical protein